MGRKKGTKKGKTSDVCARRRDGYRYTRPRSFETKLKTVKLYLEEGIPAELVAKETGIANATVFAWTKRYREHGEAGLKSKACGRRTKNICPVVKEKITAVKKNNPTFGAKRISQVLRRLFCVKASADTVRKTLKDEGLAGKPRKKRRKPRPKVRRFERAKPNQLWQSDIFTFRVLERNAYLIAFMDDYSRYIVGLGLFRSQRSDQVIEVYRGGVAEYGVPHEVLTDNGRQYANWRGKSKFTKELERDGVHHIRSATHHPQTLGKVERFWKTIWDEFLGHASFERFEEAQERIRFWMKYYNHQRPHQGIKGACPADRFFEIQQQLRDVIEKGVNENVEHLALHGSPKIPFYMVGRMGKKSVVITKEGDEMKVEERADAEEQTSEYKKTEQSEERGETGDYKGEGEENTQAVQREAEVSGSVEHMERKAETLGDIQGTGDYLRDTVAVAGPGVDGYADGAGAESEEGRGPGPGAGSETAEAGGEEGPGKRGETLEGAAASGEAQRGERGGQAVGAPKYALLTKHEVPIVARLLAEKRREHEQRIGNEREQSTERIPISVEGGVDSTGAGQADDSFGGGEASGSEPQDVLQVGEEVLVGDAGCGQRQGGGTPWQRGGRGEGGASAAVGGSGETGVGAEACGANPGPSAAEGTAEAGAAAEETTAQEEESEARAVGSRREVRW